MRAILAISGAVIYTLSTIWFFAWLENEIISEDYFGAYVATVIIHYVGLYILIAVMDCNRKKK